MKTKIQSKMLQVFLPVVLMLPCLSSTQGMPLAAEQQLEETADEMGAQRVAQAPAVTAGFVDAVLKFGEEPSVEKAKPFCHLEFSRRMGYRVSWGRNDMESTDWFAAQQDGLGALQMVMAVLDNVREKGACQVNPDPPACGIKQDMDHLVIIPGINGMGLPMARVKSPGEAREALKSLQNAQLCKNEQSSSNPSTGL